MGGDSFYDPTWESRLDQGSDPFDSALTSIVSSPVAPTSAELDGDHSMIQELIGRLGTICNSREASFGCSGPCSANTSCYGTPLNSPPELGMSMLVRNSRSHPGYPASHLPLPADAGFVERAARFSCFGGGNTMGANGSFAELPPRQGDRVDPGMFSRVSSSQNAAAWSSHRNSLGNGRMADSPEGSSISEQVPRLSVANSARKRKLIPRGKTKESPATSSAKDAEDSGQNEQSGDKKSKDNNAKAPEPPKGYIHVRARRGQATDNHSIAERARREKISQRMKVLQDLVPGCNKVTGKAAMLDEIINYVQSLQHQVEFLSMKLTTLNPRMDFNVEAFMSKEMSNPLGSSFFPADSSSSALPSGYHHHQALNLRGALGNNMESQFPMNALNVAVHPGMDGFCKASSTGASGLWEDELHNVVQMDIPPQILQGSVAAGQMKIES